MAQNILKLLQLRISAVLETEVITVQMKWFGSISMFHRITHYHSSRAFSKLNLTRMAIYKKSIMFMLSFVWYLKKNMHIRNDLLAWHYLHKICEKLEKLNQ